MGVADLVIRVLHSGLSLRHPDDSNIPLLAGDANKALGDDLDAFLLGNVSGNLSEYVFPGADVGCD